MLINQPLNVSLILTLLSIGVGLYGYTRWTLRHIRPTAGTGAMLLWCSAIWMFANAQEMGSSDLATALFWNKIQYLSMMPIPGLWLFMARQFTSSTARILENNRILMLAIVPVISAAALVTNEIHGLFLFAARIEVQDGISRLVTQPGLFFIIYHLYGYIVVFYGCVLLLRKLKRSAGFRWQGSAVLLGVALTVGFSILDWSGLSPVPQVKLAPFALVFAVPMFVISIIRTRRADLLPLVRTNIIQLISDAVLVLDSESRILNMNPTAEALLGRTEVDVLGSIIDEIWPQWNSQLNSSTRINGQSTEIRLGVADEERIFDMRKSEIRDLEGQIVSRIFVLRDVTERAKAEVALQLSEEHFRALTEHATDMVVIVDTNAVISYASPSIQKRFGYQQNEIIGKSALDYLHPDDAGNTLSALAGAAQHSGVAAPLIARFRVADGGWRKLECIANNLLEHPAVKGLVINARDVTERAEIEEKLRLSEEYFRALIENSTDVTIITGLDATIQYVSPSLERIFGRSRDQVLGHHTTEFIHPDDINALISAMAEGLSNNLSSTAVKARFFDVDGNWHILECTASNLLEHPAVRAIVVNAREVTEQEQIAQELRQSEEKYRLHFSHITDVIYSFDKDLRIVSLSPSVERVLGYKPEELLGHHLYDFAELPVLKSEYFEKAVDEARRVLGGERIEGSIYEFVSKEGKEVVAEVSSSPMIRDGEVIAAVNVGRDITERIHTSRRLQASLQEKEVLLKEIHHRVKNNMQIIASLLSLQSGSLDDPEMRAQFEDSQNRIRSMALVHERLYRSNDLSRIDFGAYLRDLTGHLMQGYYGQRQHVDLQISVDEVQLDIDTAVPCGLIVNELVSNALKHAFPQRLDGIIRIRFEKSDDHTYRMIIEDNGVGLPEHVDLKDSKTLGLQLVTSLTRQLKGTLEFHQEKGTRITISFAAESQIKPVAKVS